MEKTDLKKEFDTHFCLECRRIGDLVHFKEIDSNDIKTLCEDCYVKTRRKKDIYND